MGTVTSNSHLNCGKSIAQRACAVALVGALGASGLAFSGCSSDNNSNSGSNDTNGTQQATRNAQASVTGTITKDAKYGAATTSLTAADLEAAGFELGDSCDVSFGNGYALTDVPYYNGYYVKTGEPVIVAYPNSEYVQVQLNNADLCATAGLEDGMNVTITMNTPDKDDLTQETLGQVYSTDRADYASDEQFSNFRALTGGNLRENFLFRGASPVDNSRKRAAITDNLLKNNGIKTVIDLADSDAEMQGYFASADFSSDYTKSLYDQGRVTVLANGSSYSTDAYRQGVAKGMRALLQNGGPAYIHCMEGKDRTGFVCMLLEALAGASYDEMCADYMKTYENYYGITLSETPDRYAAVAELYFDTFAEYLLDAAGYNAIATDGYSQVETYYYQASATHYLLEAGMSLEEVVQLTALITK
jgi:hypothetical protein